MLTPDDADDFDVKANLNNKCSEKSNKYGLIFLCHIIWWKDYPDLSVSFSSWFKYFIPNNNFTKASAQNNDPSNSRVGCMQATSIVFIFHT